MSHPGRREQADVSSDRGGTATETRLSKVGHYLLLDPSHACAVDAGGVGSDLHLALHSAPAIWDTWLLVLLPLSFICSAVFYVVVERPFMNRPTRR